ncbi:putative mitochondrial protein g00810-like protein [Lasius niger]|uniref:Putative mitochondrial protein g00810-like protein n=1 Tax=Lasius niger TaxID=67767 RepID=A0A0J7KBB8_LASNI|nr:putative mitochondrial protein g00810-like protein [Lasius niger]
MYWKILENSLKSSEDNPVFFLGIEIDKKPDHIIIGQENYIGSVLENFNNGKCKPAPTPLLSNEYGGEGTANKKLLYRELIGNLSIKTRPDIAYVVGFGNRHMENPIKM